MKSNTPESHPNALKRDEILRKGKYVSIPKDWLADPTLTPTAKLVLMVYIEALGPEKQYAYPGHDLIAARIGMSPRGVQKCIEQLVAGGWLWSPGFSELATRKYCISRVRKPASAQSALPDVDDAGAQSALPAGTECAPLATQSAPKVPKGNTEGSTEASNRSGGLPAVRLATLAAVAPAARPDTAGADDVLKAEGGHVHDPSPASWVADAEYPASLMDYEAADLSFGPDQTGYCEQESSTPYQPVSGVEGMQTARNPSAASNEPEQAKELATRQPKGRAKKQSGKRATQKPSGLTDEQKRVACSSVTMMQRYLLFGAVGLQTDVDTGTLPPGKANFYQHNKADGSPDLALWTTEQWSAFYWFLAVQHRGERGQPLQLPNWGRLGKQIVGLRENMTPEQLFRFLKVVASHFHVIRFLSGNAGVSMTLDDSTLQNSLIASKARAIFEMDEEALSDTVARAIERYPTRVPANAA